MYFFSLKFKLKEYQSSLHDTMIIFGHICINHVLLCDVALKQFRRICPSTHNELIINNINKHM